MFGDLQVNIDGGLNLPLPDMVKIRQSFDSHRIDDVAAAVSRELEKPEIAARIKPGARIAIGVGSRGVANIATAVTAVKLGAIDYLAKPADADDVLNALMANPQDKADPPENPMSADRVRWEHIQRVYELCNRNVSETARRLNMHRRTLQRILAKRAPR